MVVTFGYHMKRSIREFNKYFNNIIPLPSEFYYYPLQSSIFNFVPSSPHLYRSSVAAREFVGILWYKIRY